MLSLWISFDFFCIQLHLLASLWEHLNRPKAKSERNRACTLFWRDHSRNQSKCMGYCQNNGLSDDGQTLETLAFESSEASQFILSTQRMKPIFVFSIRHQRKDDIP